MAATTSTVDATYQGRVGIAVNAALLNWVSSVRNASTGTSVNTYTSNTIVSTAIYINYISSRGGYTGSAYRIPLFFDVSSITATNTITAATLKVWGYGSATSTDTIVVKGTAWGGNGSTSTLSTSDFSNLDFSTAYSSKDLAWGGATYNDYTLNATAISDMNTNGYLNCFVIEGDYDYDGQAPSVGTAFFAGIEFLDPTNKIKVELTYSPSGYGNNPIGVASANVGDILGVATGSVSKFLGV
jgi:hypothetical protein